MALREIYKLDSRQIHAGMTGRRSEGGLPPGGDPRAAFRPAAIRGGDGIRLSGQPPSRLEKSRAQIKIRLAPTPHSFQMLSKKTRHHSRQKMVAHTTQLSFLPLLLHLNSQYARHHFW